MLSQIYEYGDHNNRAWGQFTLTGLLDAWGDFLSLLGYQNSNLGDWETNTQLFTLPGILGAAGLVLAAALVFGLYRLLRRWHDLALPALVVVLTFVMVCVVQGAVFAWTEGSDLANASYWLTPLPLALVIMELACQEETFTLTWTRQACALGFMVCIIACSIASTTTFMQSPMRAVPEQFQVMEWLQYRGYTQGYASFWHAGVMTEWSSGEIEVWTRDDHGFGSKHWLQSAAHEEPPQGKLFYLTTVEELEDMGKDYTQMSHLEYGDENGYIVFLYDSYDELLADFS